MMEVSRGRYIRRGSGVRWYPECPRAEEVVLSDLGDPVVRWCGSCGLYFTWEHQVRTALILQSWGCSALVQLMGGVHDVHEVYPPGDVPGPVLHSDTPYGREARRLETLARDAVRTRLCLPASFGAEVKAADQFMLAWEARDLLPGGHRDDFHGLPDIPATYPDLKEDGRDEDWRLEWWALVARLAQTVADEIRAEPSPELIPRMVALAELAACARREMRLSDD